MLIKNIQIILWMVLTIAIKRIFLQQMVIQIKIRYFNQLCMIKSINLRRSQLSRRMSSVSKKVMLMIF